MDASEVAVLRAQHTDKEVIGILTKYADALIGKPQKWDIGKIGNEWHAVAFGDHGKDYSIFLDPPAGTGHFSPSILAYQHGGNGEEPDDQDWDLGEGQDEPPIDADFVDPDDHMLIAPLDEPPPPTPFEERAQVDELGVVLTGHVTFGELYDLATGRMRDLHSAPCVIGDALNAMELGWGEHWTQALDVAEDLRLSPWTITQWKSVTARIPYSERKAGVSWGMMRYAAQLEPPQRKQAFAYYLAGNTTEDTIAHMRGIAAPAPQEEPIPDYTEPSTEEPEVLLAAEQVPGAPEFAARCPICDHQLAADRSQVAVTLLAEVEAFAKTGELGYLLKHLREVVDNG